MFMYFNSTANDFVRQFINILLSHLHFLLCSYDCMC